MATYQVNPAHRSRVRDLQKLLPFIHAVRCGSFIGAAVQLEVTPPAISKSIARLEEEIGVRLFTRTTRRLHLTDEGRELFDRIDPLLSGIDEAVSTVQDAGSVPRGLVRISVTPTFGRYCLMPLIAEFARLYPDIQLEVSFDEIPPSLVEQGIDVRLQYGRGRETSHVSRLLCEYALILVASPGYVARRGLPAAPEQLAEHDCIGIRTSSGLAVWDLLLDPALAGEAVRDAPARHLHHPQGPLIVAGQLDASLMATMCDAGIAPTWELIVEPYLRTGQLVRVLPHYRLHTAPHDKMSIYAHYPHREYLPAKVRVVLEFLYARFGERGHRLPPADVRPGRDEVEPVSSWPLPPA